MHDIRGEQPYTGVRVRMEGRLGQARLHLQVDIGFGDVITPERQERDYPTLLDLPAPRLWTYPRETLVAEKLDAMVRLGTTNTRVKDPLGHRLSRSPFRVRRRDGASCG